MSEYQRDHDHDHEGERDDEHGDRHDVGENGPTYCAYTDYTQDGSTVESLPATGEGSTGLERRVWDRLYAIDDPEMPVSIVDLGLIYGVRIVDPESSGNDTGTVGDEDGPSDDGDDGDDAGDGAGGRVVIDMTLTYTGCPAREMLTDEVKEAVAAVDGVGSVDLDLVWSPNWSLAMVTEQGRADLREFGLSVPDPEREAA